MLQPKTIQFLDKLKKNNNKAWFESHRDDYNSARSDFEDLVSAIIDQYGRKDSEIANLKAKDCLFRINRDVRFSKDKSPYKDNMGASFSRGGKKSHFAGYYLHCEPGRSFVGGGIWMPEPGDVKKIRQEIDYCYDEFRGILSGQKFKENYQDLDRSAAYSLVNTPKEYDKSNPAAADLKLKSWIAMRTLSDSELSSPSLVKLITGAFYALQPLVKFINRAIE